MIYSLITVALIYGANGYGDSICANMTTANTPNARKCLKAAYEYYNYTKLDMLKMKYLHALITGSIIYIIPCEFAIYCIHT